MEKKGDARRTSGASESRGRIGSAPFPSPLIDNNVNRLTGSERAIRRMLV